MKLVNIKQLYVACKSVHSLTLNSTLMDNILLFRDSSFYTFNYKQAP